MSENEIKENTNKNSGKHHRRGHHRHHKKSNNQNRPIEQKADDLAKKENETNLPQSNNRQDNKSRDNDKRSNKNNRRDKNEKKLEYLPGIFDTNPENDAIFGKLSTTPQPTKKSREPVEETVDIPEIPDEELYGTSHIFYTPKIEENIQTVEVVGVRFKPHGKIYYFDPNGMNFSKGDHAVLETARGLEFGEICLPNTKVKESNIVQPLQKICRLAVKEDYDRNAMNKQREKDAFNVCLEKIAEHGLDMKLVDVQCAFDNSKLLFYFTSAGRVDFRELVRDLASQFKTRIELRQIGIRDEAKLIGGIGICGRPLCCSRHLSNFAQVSIKMAKEQGLSLSSNKISGNCGRLMCCLNFENQTYLDEIKRTPMPDSQVKVDSKVGTVIDANVLTGMLKVKFNDAEGETVSVHRDSVVVIRKKEEKTEEEPQND